jgi:hypothetical protein
MSDIIDRLRDAIATAVGEVLLDDRKHLLGDFAFIASTLGTEDGDEGDYLTVFSKSPRHAQIGIVELLRGFIELTDDEEEA